MPEFKSKEEYEKWKAEKTKSNADKLRQQTGEKAQASQELSESNANQAPLSFSCPKCLSENIQKASLLISLETKELKATSSTIGVGAGSAGVGIGISGSSTNGTITATLARQLSPPKEPQQPLGNCLLVTWGLSALISVPLMMDLLARGKIEAAASLGPLGIIAPVIAIGGPIYHYFYYVPERNKKYEQAKAQYKYELAKWEKTFCCLRCGEIFQIG